MNFTKLYNSVSNEVDYSKIPGYKRIKPLLFIVSILFFISVWSNWISFQVHGVFHLRTLTEGMYRGFNIGSAIILYFLCIRFKWFLRTPILVWILVSGYYWCKYSDHFFFMYIIGNYVNCYAILKAQRDIVNYDKSSVVDLYPMDFWGIVIGTIILMFYYQAPML